MSIRPMYDVLLAQLRQAENVEEIVDILSSAGFARNLEVVEVNATSVTIPVLSGGTEYRFSQPLEYLEVASVIDTPVEDRLRFIVASGGMIVFPLSCGNCPEDLDFEDNKSYLVAVMDNQVIGGPYKPGVSE